MKQAFKAAAVMVAMTLGSQAIAAPSTYSCEITSKASRGGFIPSEMYIVIEPDATTADLYFSNDRPGTHKPFTAKAVKISDQKYRLKLTLDVPTSSDGTIKTAYTVRFDQGRQTFTISATVHGYDNRESGNGRCKPV